VVVDPGFQGGAIDVAWPLLTTAAPQVGGTCGVVPRWDPVRARLSIVIDGPAPCSMHITATS
jgi:hypothetical protein